MIPTRSQLLQWSFDAINRAGVDVAIHGVAIEEAGGNVAARCNELPALRGWEGATHDAAAGAFERAKAEAVVLGEFGDLLAPALSQGFWSLKSAKDNIVGFVADVESREFLVNDRWVVTLKPEEMAPEEAGRRMVARNDVQTDLNDYVHTLGAADDNLAQSINEAAEIMGFGPATSMNPLDLIVGPPGGLPDPLSLQSQMQQRIAADADAALTVASTVSGTDDNGNATMTVHMQDGSWKVQTDEREPYRTLREDVFDPAGNKVSSSETFTWEDGGAPITRIYYADGTFVRIAGSADGTPSVLIQAPGQEAFELPPDSEFFTHQAETLIGGGLAATETAAAERLAAGIVAPHTDEMLRIVQSGARYTGPALATAVALGDVLGAETASERCRASISGVSSVLGGSGVGALGASFGGPFGAGAGSAIGSWFFGWVGSEVGRLVCY